MHKSAYTSAILTILLFSIRLSALQTATETIDTTPAALRQLVRRAVNNDLNSTKVLRTKEMYRLKRETPRGSQLKQIVETKTITIGRLLEINGAPLTADQQRTEDDRLNHLASNPDEQRRKLKEEKQDDDNATQIFRALPDAFIYKFEGITPNGSDEIIHMSFSPDPQWNPPSRDVQVLTGMMGTLDIDRQEERIAKIHGVLFRDVDFGWGILGRLYKGGQFTVEQSKVGEHRWETTHMVLDITGKALLFKSLIFKETQHAYDFQPVPEDLSVEDGIRLLRSVPVKDKAQADNRAPR